MIWMARHMVEGQGWVSEPLETVFPVERLLGLRRVDVHVRWNGNTRACWKLCVQDVKKIATRRSLRRRSLETGWLDALEEWK